MQRRQEFEAFAVFPPGDERHFATAQAVIGEGDGAGVALAGDLEPGETGAEFGRQRQVAGGGGGVGLEGERHGGQHAGCAGWVAAMGLYRDLAGGAAAGAGGGELHCAVVDGGGGESDDRGGAFEDGDRSARLQFGQKPFAAFAGEAVGEPARFEILVAQHGGGFGHGAGGGLPRGRGEAGEATAPCLGGLEIGGLRFRQTENGDGPGFAPRFSQHRVEQRLLGGPVAGGGPGAVEHDQQRAGGDGFAIGAGVQERAGEADDQRAHA